MATTLDRVASSLQRNQEASAKEIKDQTVLQEQMVKQLEGVYENIKTIKEYFLKDAEQQRKWREEEKTRQEEAKREGGRKVISGSNIASSPNKGDIAMKSIFDSILGAFGLTPLLSQFKTLFTALTSRILLPLVAIITFVDNFIEEYKQTGSIFDSTKNGLIKTIRELVILPLDLIKDVVSWAARKMGFDNFADWLDRFSFTKLFDESIAPAISSLMDLIGKHIKKFAEGFRLLLSDPVEGVKKILGATLSFFTDFGSWMYFNILRPILTWFLGEDVVKNGEETIKNFLGNSLELITNFGKWFYDKLVKPVSTWFSTLTSDPVKVIKDLLAGSISLLADFGKWFYDNLLKPTLNWLLGEDIVKNGEETIKKLLGDSAEMLTDFGSWVYKRIVSPLVNFFKNIKSDPVTAIKTLLGDALTLFTDIGTWFYNNLLKPVLNWILGPEVVKEGEETIKKLLGDSAEMLTDFGSWTYKRIVSPLVNFFKNIKSNPVESIKTLLGDALTLFTDVASWTYTNILRPLLSWFLGEEVVKKGEDVANKIKGYLGSALDFFVNTGKWLYDNILKPSYDGAMSIIPSTEEIKKWVNEFTTKYSFSNLFSSIGKMIKDYVMGIIKSIPGAETLMNATSGISNWFTSSNDVQTPTNNNSMAAARIMDRMAIESLTSKSSPIVVAPTINNIRDGSSSGGVTGNINVNTNPGKSGYEDPVTIWNAM